MQHKFLKYNLPYFFFIDRNLHLRVGVISLTVLNITLFCESSYQGVLLKDNLI